MEKKTDVETIYDFKQSFDVFLVGYYMFNIILECPLILQTLISVFLSFFLIQAAPHAYQPPSSLSGCLRFLRGSPHVVSNCPQWLLASG